MSVCINNTLYIKYFLIFSRNYNIFAFIYYLLTIVEINQIIDYNNGKNERLYKIRYTITRLLLHIHCIIISYIYEFILILNVITIIIN